MSVGDLVSFQTNFAWQTAHLVIFDDKGAVRPECLGLNAQVEVRADWFEAGRIQAWIANNGGQARGSWPATLR